VPGPPGGPGQRPTPPPTTPDVPGADDATRAPAGTSFGDLDQRPVSEHVDVFEAEHARLERELRTIDQL
jgi:hypothetical protein